MTSQSWLRTSIRYGYFPLMAVGVNGLPIAAIVIARLGQTKRISWYGGKDRESHRQGTSRLYSTGESPSAIRPLNTYCLRSWNG